VRTVIGILENETLREFWLSLGLILYDFEDVGLDPKVADDVLWHVCQQQQIVLITANRNHDGPDSLEATIRAHNTLTSLPVFTIADDQRVLTSKDYAERVALKLLDYLLDIDRVRGAGRLYIP
jgi:hypothetical protein